ncbi:hypothetical protein HRG_004469 [Hirsutella rhossiliensis]|uniref:Uncharacterized protein n=1 Tax=Hirsutella rhossiliensis TaxID=111463 RepID=A0A9P8SKE0_9HYPO|nr:uncharacterized protein HRG_04469 [Hirsutella rhossiliensis]KAH0964041.1 hypothetical protein HRG_04469 [Hirsutella rhossiliensis]
MVSNKKRLYVALYPSGVVNNEERRYHWGFLVGPKIENRQQVPGMRYHVRNLPIQGWAYEQVRLDNVRSTNNLLARIAIAKVEDEERLVRILREIPIVQNDPSWRCRTWVSNALVGIAKDGQAVGTAQLDWAQIETLAREYVAGKTVSGRYSVAEDMANPKPTWDMLERRETVP